MDWREALLEFKTRTESKYSQSLAVAGLEREEQKDGCEMHSK